MSTSKLRTFFFIFLWFAIIFGFMVFGVFVYNVPDSKAGIFLFKLGYNSSINTRWFLELYSPKLRGVQAGYIPGEVSSYLCRRLDSTEDPKEIAAIVNLYIIQSPDREGGILGISDETHEKVAKQIVTEMESDEDFFRKIVLLEEIRRGESFGKGKIIGFSDDKIAEVRTKYQEWINLDIPWVGKTKISPLENTGIKVLHCCG